MKNFLLIAAAVVLLYLLAKNRQKVLEAAQSAGGSVFNLVDTDSGPVSGSVQLPASNNSGNNSTVTVVSSGQDFNPVQTDYVLPGGSLQLN